MSGHIVRTQAGTFRANWRDPAGRQRAKTFPTKKAATAFLAEVHSAVNRGLYVDPHAGRQNFGPYAKRWLAAAATGREWAADRTAPPLETRVRRSTRPEAATLPLLGTIAAGRPIEAIENPEAIEVPASLLGAGERYALRVRGDSMVDDGIQDGDVVVVRSARRAENGQTVVAIVDGEATLKRFHGPERGGRWVELRPANAAMKPLRVAADRLEIRGVLVGLLRRYT